MAEHLGQTVEPEMNAFNGMGKPLGENARTEAYKCCKQIGLSSAKAWECVQVIANHLERDEPYQAQHAGMKFVDLCGTYRIMAVLLAAAEIPHA